MLNSLYLDTLSRHVIEGLKQTPKRLPSAYFYDDEGSRLFQRIMQLPGYYLTEAEREIMVKQWPKLLDALSPDGRPFELVELGSGDGSKTLDLCAAFAQAGAQFAYQPIDTSAHALHSLQEAFLRKLPQLPVRVQIGDYHAGWQRSANHGRQIVMFMGSNLGNLAQEEAAAFLRLMRNQLAEGDGLLIGLDLMKNPHTILAAYNDPEGVTAAFNLNLLTRMNREMGTNFLPDRFSHYATYSPLDGAARSFLVSLCAQTVRSDKLGLRFDFTAGETIYTEQSQKYSQDMITQMARQSDFVPRLRLQDSQGLYCVTYWQAV
ncbi:MAG: L-histidine N(alpha)-methyltransferase [Aquabacterium sp.]